MTIRVPLKKAPLESLSTLSDSIASIEQQEAETRRPPRESVRILLAEGELSVARKEARRRAKELMCLLHYTDNDLIREIVTKTVQKMKVSRVIRRRAELRRRADLSLVPSRSSKSML